MNTPFARFTPKARLAAAAVATVLSLSPLAACGGGSSGSGDSKSLEMWTFKQSHVAGLRNAAAEFKKQTGITVKIEAYGPDDAYTTKVQAAAKTHDLPDVLETHSDGEDLVLGATGMAKDIAGDVDAARSGLYQKGVQVSGTVTDAKYTESKPADSKTHGVSKGQRFSVPFTSGTFGIVMANKKMLAATGITKAPANWDEFLADLKATTTKDPKNGGVSLGLKVKATGPTWVLQALAFAQLGKEKYQALFGKEPTRTSPPPTAPRSSRSTRSSSRTGCRAPRPSTSTRPTRRSPRARRPSTSAAPSRWPSSSRTA
ncbi:extracellular solute-binding protein [Streptomyces sp. NPDC008139]|uniref:extracellular solute-binding protein n=1 Tax=Streptomyces sp. NPDC008139 TaxID=3364814 RepID=UPI0036E3F4D0